MREFGTWSDALVVLREHLRGQGIDLQPRWSSYYTEEQLCHEIERVWQALGHRPSTGDWNAMQPAISYPTYTRHCHGWTQACLKFIESRAAPYQGSEAHEEDTGKGPRQAVSEANRHDKGRTIPLRLRMRVLDRDNFRCGLCGRSPATQLEVSLHLDHIVPVSKGGTSVLDNLRTLCADCNIGRGAQQQRAAPIGNSGIGDAPGR